MGGIFCGQFRGLPAPGRPDTWSGCSFTGDEIADFVRSRDLRLVAISGEGTQYMMVTLRRAARAPAATGATIEAVTAADGSACVPQRGPRASISLWGRGLPAASDLNDLSVVVGGTRVRGCYLSPIGASGGYQMNVLLPKAIAPRPVPVELYFRGATIGKGSIEVVPGPEPEPRLVSLTDEIDLTLSFKVRGRKLHAVLEDILNPADISFFIDGRPARKVHYECTHALLDRYCFAVALPRAVRKGIRPLTILVGSRELPRVEMEVL